MKALVLALMLSGPSLAQEAGQPLVPEFTDSSGAELRFLDKLTSETGDVTLNVGQTAKFGRLVVRLDSCRYPTGNPASDSEAHLTIVEDATQAELFNGWMLASSPALSALDHPRYDVWVLSCVLPDAAKEPATSKGVGE
ncbi:DUF2155 domain-containing protein [Tabrizicola sp.]|jgi:hypothetical protein|uniref:DUF2155 domain-containing protein n=1 Tax=Tabrizicola sp. TaxID=2005166 RepID=UPI000BC4D8D2|nr:DUF2155 domain-containing protein [Tabrizicola sp.]MBY0351136.1 DUF2155 domain-containing protein [Tabrizicola sp.]MDK2774703.1 DUF2155 domain-containing protein [Tabrizicola sp.]OYX19759.1 MAG: hypothetical protein B7Z04_08315 [Rhodobacterales bacterium 32-66-9]